MRTMLTLGTASVLVLTLGACASRKPVVEDTKPVAPVEKPAEPVKADPKPEIRIETVPPVQGPAPGTVQDFVVNVGDRVYFDYNQFNLDASDRARLDRQAAWLQQYPSTRILVAGNADERGTREYNLALGERRANAVRSYLVSQGVDGSRIEVVSYGKERPIDPRSNEEAWALNRNGHTAITSGASS